MQTNLELQKNQSMPHLNTHNTKYYSIMHTFKIQLMIK